jgi:hypothetical protein
LGSAGILHRDAPTAFGTDANELRILQRTGSGDPFVLPPDGVAALLMRLVQVEVSAVVDALE